MAERAENQALADLEVSMKNYGLADFDSQALAHVVNGAEFEHRRLSGGSPDIDLLQCSLPHSVINRGNYSPAVLVNGTFSRNAITIGMITRQKQPTILNNSKVKLGTIEFCSENSEMCYRAWPENSWMTLVIERERLLQFSENHFGGPLDLPAGGITTIQPKDPKSGEQLLDCLRDLDHSLRLLNMHSNISRIGESVENDLLARIVGFLSVKPIVRRSGDHRRLRLCGEILRDTISMVEDDPSEMLDLHSMSRVTGLSPRTLQRTFQVEFGLCPQEWLRLERLNRVRDELSRSNSETSVTQVATRWGFFHLGRFSQYYRELFGEKPSETLAHRSLRQHTSPRYMS
jgi:AraC family transcriptional regulator, ethanolamine operon transcriptional activator